MKVIGITGSLATGKTTIAHCLRNMDIPVHDADFVAGKTLLNPETQGILKRFCPEAFSGGFHKHILRDWAYRASDHLDHLERLIHPQVQEDRHQFLHRAYEQQKTFVALDIPLLYEKGLDSLCDWVIIAYCSKPVQVQRILHSKHLNPAQMDFVLSRQMPLGEKLLRGDCIVRTDIPQKTLKRNIQSLWEGLRKNT